MRLSELPFPELEITAGPSSVRVEIRYRYTELIQPCAMLADDFAATVNGVPMTITERGAAEEGGCTWPGLRLDNPAAAPRTSLVLGDPSPVITADLADMLALRSAQLVPDGPWTFTPGQAVTLQWSPASDFATHRPDVAFVYDDPSRGSTIFAPALATIAGDRITVRTPSVAIMGTLQVTMYTTAPDGIDPSLSCTGASCAFTKAPQFAHLIESR